MVASDATGGGALAAPTGCPSLVVPGKLGEECLIVGHALDGVSVNECTITCAGEEGRWPTTGFSLRPTSDGSAIGGGKSVEWWDNPVPVKSGQTIAFAGTSGANYMWNILYLDVPPYNFKMPMPGPKAKAVKWTRSTAASGTNLTANTLQTGLVTLANFGDYAWQIDDIHADAAFTTNPIIGLKLDKKEATPYRLYFILPLTDVAQDWERLRFPGDQLPIGLGDVLDIGWLGETAEQPTAKITFKRAIA